MGQPARKRHKTDPPPLSAQETRFCQLYAEAGDATRAYIDAGLRHTSEAAAARSARQLLRRLPIRRYIRQLQTDASAAAAVTVEGLARGFQRAADADLTRLLGPDGEMLPPSEWPEDVRLCITRIEVQQLTESRPDPDNPRRKKKVTVGTKWKVWLENKTECRKVLARWTRMLAPGKGGHDGSEKGAGGGIDLELVARAAAVLAAGGVPGGAAVVPEPGAAGGGVSE
ncbi:MAG: terminase small subunit [Planctomycetes bacterium]|nr:terminase small subunit [Planctomycetota bacterium]